VLKDIWANIVSFYCDEILSAKFNICDDKCFVPLADVFPCVDKGTVTLPYTVCIVPMYWLTSLRTANVFMRHMLSLEQPCGIENGASVCEMCGDVPCPTRQICIVQSRERTRVCISETCDDSA